MLRFEPSWFRSDLVCFKFLCYGVALNHLFLYGFTCAPLFCPSIRGPVVQNNNEVRDHVVDMDLLMDCCPPCADSAGYGENMQQEEGLRGP